eukprot:CAMPEP_0171074798 /NCGR_PEP_ID=MMETSP0766_2-20121228/12378_1 /TAXON_ID=439317 /ORGANISM="Gambierdiscus australes, Strain CAWD 149" /LENGTH=222 /DNA_ID=CAMNT_0011531615 /DNA_START=107 /DNA_END=771 /DNA_ORIENTATION=+
MAGPTPVHSGDEGEAFGLEGTALVARHRLDEPDRLRPDLTPRDILQILNAVANVTRAAEAFARFQVWSTVHQDRPVPVKGVIVCVQAARSVVTKCLPKARWCLFVTWDALPQVIGVAGAALGEPNLASQSAGADVAVRPHHDAHTQGLLLADGLAELQAPMVARHWVETIESFVVMAVRAVAVVAPQPDRSSSKAHPCESNKTTKAHHGEGWPGTVGRVAPG